MRRVIYKLANGKVTTNYAEAVANGNYQLALETIPEAPLRMSEKMKNRRVKLVGWFIQPTNIKNRLLPVFFIGYDRLQAEIL